MRFEKINTEINCYNIVLSQMIIYPTELVGGNYHTEVNISRIKTMLRRKQYALGIIRRMLRAFK